MIGREHRASLEAGSPTTNLLIALLQNYGAVIVCLAAMLHFALYEAGGAFLAKMVRGEDAIGCVKPAICSCYASLP